jgi:hypothetical protein
MGQPAWLARALIYITLQSVVDWPLGKLTYGKNEKELIANEE